MHFGPFLAPFGSQNRSQNRSKPPLGHREPPEACLGAWGPSKGMQNAPQIKPRTLKIHPPGNDFTPKMLPRWIQATLGAHGTTRSMPRSPWSPKRQPAWSQNLTHCTCSLTFAWSYTHMFVFVFHALSCHKTGNQKWACHTFNNSLTCWLKDEQISVSFFI